MYYAKFAYGMMLPNDVTTRIIDAFEADRVEAEDNGEDPLTVEDWLDNVYGADWLVELVKPHLGGAIPEYSGLIYTGDRQDRPGDCDTPCERFVWGYQIGQLLPAIPAFDDPNRTRPQGPAIVPLWFRDKCRVYTWVENV